LSIRARLLESVLEALYDVVPKSAGLIVRDDALQWNDHNLLARSHALFDEDFLEVLLTKPSNRGDIAGSANADQSCKKEQVDKHARTEGKKERNDHATGLLHFNGEIRCLISEEASSEDFSFPGPGKTVNNLRTIGFLLDNLFTGFL
jgi:hypothetical protein